MDRRLIIDSDLLEVTIKRLCQQLIENHNDFDNSVMLGLQPRGIFLASRLAQTLEAWLDKKIPLGQIDATFHRDDFRRRQQPLKAAATNIPFIIEGKRVVLVDDVLYTGRTVRAALDAMISFGRPQEVEFLVMINRKHSRELPIQPDYIGREVNTMQSQRVAAEWKEQGFAKDNFWLIDKEEA